MDWLLSSAKTLPNDLSENNPKLLNELKMKTRFDLPLI